MAMLLQVIEAAAEGLQATPNVMWEVPYLAWVCLELQHNAYKQSPLYSMLICYLCYCFGGIVQVVVTGIHGTRPFYGIVPYDSDAALFFLVWFLIFYTKVNSLCSSRLGLLLLSLMSAVGWARAVMWQFDSARAWFPDQMLPPLLSATCSGYGGILCMSLEAVLFNRPERHRLTPSVRASMKTSFAMAVLYWASTAGAGMSPAVGQLLVTSLMILWTVLGQLAGVYVDACYPAEVLFRWVVVLCCGPHHQHLLNSFMVHAVAKSEGDSAFTSDLPDTEMTESLTEAPSGSETLELDYGIEEFNGSEHDSKKAR